MILLGAWPLFAHETATGGEFALPESPPLPRPRPEPPYITPSVTFNKWPFDRELERCTKDKKILSGKEGRGPTEIPESTAQAAIAAGAPEAAVKRMVDFFNKNSDRIKNRKYFTIVDFEKKSSEKRMYVVEIETGNVTSHLVSHGDNSDANNDGILDANGFSNTNNSHQSSCGFLMTGLPYDSKNYSSAFTLHGMQSGINDNVCGRAVVFHNKEGGGPIETWGCLGVPKEDAPGIMEKIKGWSPVYIHPCKP